MRRFKAYKLDRSRTRWISKFYIYSNEKGWENLPGETDEDIAKIGGYSISPNIGVHSTFKILPISSCLGQYTYYQHVISLLLDSKNNHFELKSLNTLIIMKVSVTSPVASGMLVKLEGVLSPTNHWYFKINCGSVTKVLSCTKEKWQRQVSSSNGWSIKASLTRKPGGKLSFHCSTRKRNVESVQEYK